MQDINSKSQFTGTLPVPDDEVHTAPEYNDRRDELQNSVVNTGLALDEADTVQLSKAMFANGVAAQSMLDNSVSANLVQLTPITGASGLRLPTPVAIDYSALNGAIFSFKVANTNTGNMTVNVGQTVGTLIGVKSLFLEDGTTEVPSGTVISGTYYTVRYDASLDSGSGAFILLLHRSKLAKVQGNTVGNSSAVIDTYVLERSLSYIAGVGSPLKIEFTGNYFLADVTGTVRLKINGVIVVKQQISNINTNGHAPSAINWVDTGTGISRTYEISFAPTSNNRTMTSVNQNCLMITEIPL